MEGRNIAGYRQIYNYRTGVHISEEFMYSRLSLIFQEGAYLFLPDR